MTWRAQGMRTWLLQRISALYMLLYLIVMTVVVCNMDVVQFKQWRELFTSPVINIVTLIFFLSLLYHAWVGVRDILVDYVRNQRLNMQNIRTSKPPISKRPIAYKKPYRRRFYKKRTRRRF